MNSDLQPNDFLGKGWSFPPTFTPGRQPVAMTTKQADIEASLRILLTTRQGERVMEPKYGCNLDRYVFESLDTTTTTIMADMVQTAILLFEPRIDAKSVTANIDNELAGMILIEVDYVIRSTNSRLNFVFPYYLNEGTELNFLTNNAPPG